MVKISRTHHRTRNGLVKRNPRKVNSYLRLQQKIQKDINTFPMFFAFSNEQFDKGLKKLGVKKQDLVTIPGGGFIRRADGDRFTAMVRSHDRGS
jgi:hypothetical protein